MERKSASSKTHSPDVPTSVDQPHSNGMLTVVSPPVTSSTPSSPNHRVAIPRNRSHSSDAGWPATSMEVANNSDDDDDDVDNDVNSGGNESIGFSLAELASYCKAGDQHEGTDENREVPDDEHSCKSFDHDDVTRIRGSESTADTSSTASSKAPLQVCGVKPPLVEQPAQKAPVVDEWPNPPSAPTKLDSSSDNQQPKQRASGGAGTRSKTKPKFPEAPRRQTSDAIIDITQAKKVSHRAVVARSQKTSDQAGDCKVVGQRRPQTEQSSAAAATTPSPNATTANDLPKSTSSKAVRGVTSQQSIERGNSGKGSRVKDEAGSAAEQPVRQPSLATQDKKQEKVPTTTDGTKESTTRQHDNPATPSQAEPEPAKPEMKVVVRSKPLSGTTAPASNDKQKHSTAKSTSSKAVPSPPNVAVNATAEDEDESDEDDWMNQITSLRDPDDVRHRKIEPRRGSKNMNVWGQKLQTKPAKEEKTEEEEEGEEVNDVCNNLV